MYLREKISADVIMIKDVLKASVDYSYNYTSRKRVDVQNPVKYSKKPGEVMLESASAGSSRQQVTYFTRYQAANAYLTSVRISARTTALHCLQDGILKSRNMKRSTFQGPVSSHRPNRHSH